MDLDIRRVIGSIQGKRPQEELAPLMTEWGERVLSAAMADPSYVPYGDSHPRPQMARGTWRSLNGWWEYAFVSCEDASSAWRGAVAPESLDGRILVPFSPEARLSGVGRQLGPDELLWYRRGIEAPEMPEGCRCLLHLDGVDHACSVWLGGAKLAEHEGAYLPFVVDITDALAAGARTLEVCVFDPSETGTQLRGKQRLDRGTMWYTAQSGIWKDVWLEVVPQTHIADLRLVPNAGDGTVAVEVEVAGGDGTDVVDVTIGTATATASGENLLVSLDGPVREWTPEDPYLYDVSVRLGEDEVTSYVAFRTVAVEADDDGTPRLMLNHEPRFLRGLLDQGYWPDGLLTPPSEDAIEADIRAAREMGFNLLRKHIKVESDRWYAACDRLGMLVWQDMPSGGSPLSDWQTQQKPTLFSASWSRMRDDTPASWDKLAAGDARYRREWRETCAATVRRLAAHPSVIAWVLFNESWGQFCSAERTAAVRELDPTRPVVSVSGWYDQGTGDFFTVHNYFRGMHAFRDPYAGRRARTGPAAPPACGRAFVVSEFGGLTWHVDGHSSLDRAYGYAQFEGFEDWERGVRELLAQADALEREGMAGFVYTQLTDVEEETNGLLTYDRRVRKLGGAGLQGA